MGGSSAFARGHATARYEASQQARPFAATRLPFSERSVLRGARWRPSTKASDECRRAAAIFLAAPVVPPCQRSLPPAAA